MIKLHTNHGVITLNLFDDKAPETVANFKQYVQEGHYDNTVFHRVISNFMIQGGGFEPGMKQKTTRAPIKNEANNGVANKIGTVAMARTMEPHSASAQFFINVGDNSFLYHTIPATSSSSHVIRLAVGSLAAALVFLGCFALLFRERLRLILSAAKLLRPAA
jgi:peptidyl-prolyl cis-trans isomerase B (cyclophilin B)